MKHRYVSVFRWVLMGIARKKSLPRQSMHERNITSTSCRNIPLIWGAWMHGKVQSIIFFDCLCSWLFYIIRLTDCSIRVFWLDSANSRSSCIEFCSWEHNVLLQLSEQLKYQAFMQLYLLAKILASWGAKTHWQASRQFIRNDCLPLAVNLGIYSW